MFNKNKIILLFTILFLFIRPIKVSSQNMEESNKFMVGILGVYYGDYTNSYYEDELPIIIQVEIIGNYNNAIDFGRNDWYNMLKFSVLPKRALFYFDENSNLVKLEGYNKDKPFAEEERRNLSYNILEKEDLIDGKLEPYLSYKERAKIDRKVKPSIRKIKYNPPKEEIKSILIQILDDDNTKYMNYSPLSRRKICL